MTSSGRSVISHERSTTEKIVSNDVLALPQVSHIRYRNDDNGESNLWSLTSAGSATAAIESLLLNPIHEVATFVDEHLVAPTGEVISNTGEVISHLTSNFFHQSAEEETDEDSSEEMDDERGIQEPPCIDVHQRSDREEVELIARHSKDDQFMVSDSLLGDPTGLEDPMLSMNLRVIRGRNLPFTNSRIRVSVLDENGVIDQVLGTTPWSKNYKRDPIWGTAACSWSLLGKPSTQLLFSLEQNEENYGEHDPGEKKEENREECRKTLIFVKLDALDLMVMRNPNLWIKLQDHSSTKSMDCGCIQVRLTQPKMATLHQQENCPRISPGPAFPRMESYAVRKQAMYCCSPVILNVYDVSHDSRIESINNTVKSMGYGGIFHAAIQIHGKEYSFGGTRDQNSKNTGIFCSRPKRCPMHHYRESVYLGDCELSSKQVNSILDDLRPIWLATTYNMFRKNCAFFSREFAIELGVGDIPVWVFSLASSAEFIEPYAIKLNTYLKNRTKIPRDDKRPFRYKVSTASQSKRHAKRIAVLLEENGSMEVQCAASSTQEMLLDHAMAARIQRNFRASSSRNLDVRQGIGSTLRKN